MPVWCSEVFSDPSNTLMLLKAAVISFITYRIFSNLAEAYFWVLGKVLHYLPHELVEIKLF
jgi:hypothetical protein